MQIRKVWFAALAATTSMVWSGVASSAAQPSLRTNVITGVHAGFNLSQSNNWSGYNQGFLEHRQQFHEVSGTWVVPTAQQARGGEFEASATWVGIGGGCLGTGCALTDETLIQAGTEQEVDSSGNQSYWAWWEIIPEPETAIGMQVSPGQAVHVEIHERLPELWTITIQNLSTGAVFTHNVDYPSSHLTAEWILETPLIVGSGGFSAMPNLSTVNIDGATVNYRNPNLQPQEAIQLAAGNGQILATPSAPDSDGDGFNDCSYATSCPIPGS